MVDNYTEIFFFWSTDRSCHNNFHISFRTDKQSLLNTLELQNIRIANAAECLRVERKNAAKAPKSENCETKSNGNDAGPIENATTTAEDKNGELNKYL